MKQGFAIALAAVLLAGCAGAEDRKPADAAKAPAAAKCEPPPTQLVTKDLVVGNGRTVENRTPILVNYTGWLYDGCVKDFKGREFDTSIGRPTPFGFIAGIGNVIKGWQQGVIGMKEHGRRLLIIPPDMAYGAQSNDKIPPNSTLVFEVEVITIVGGNPTRPAQPRPQ